MDTEKKPEQAPDPSMAGFPGSTNEPVAADAAAAPAPKAEADYASQSEEDTVELPPNHELERMTRAELDALAEVREVDISGCGNKQDVIDALRKDERKRKRAAAKED